jgi:hypothetical protein
MCGAQAAHAAARFCSGCGAPLHPATEAPPTAQNEPKESVNAPAVTAEVPVQTIKQPEITTTSTKQNQVATSAFAVDTIVGVDLLPSEKILRITPCKLKTFTQVKECILYVTSQRLVCISSVAGMASTIAKLAKKANYNVESLMALKDIIRADVNNGKIKVTILEGKNTKSSEYVIGRFPHDLGEFIMKVRRGDTGDLSEAKVDVFEDPEVVKSVLGKGIAATGKAIYVGTKLSIEKYQQLNKIAKDSERVFADAAKEEDKIGWSKYRGEKGREAERRVANLLESLGYKTFLNVHLQEREIDIIAEKGSVKYMIECKFGSKAIDVGDLDKYVMLYHHARASALKVNGLIFICPTAGITEYAKSNVLIQYPNENIRVIGTRNFIQEIEELA